MMIGAFPVPDFVVKWVAIGLAAVVLIIGSFSAGYYKAHKSGEEKLAVAAAKANEKYIELQKKKVIVQEKIVTEYVDKIVEVTKWRTKNVEVTKLVPDTGVLSNGWVSVHDSSATGRYADPARASDATSSGVTTVEALAGVVNNYGVCRATTEQLVSLQKWILEQQKLVDESNKK